MRVIACLAWYCEPLPFLDRLVRSLSGHVDALVAVDGPWEGFPGVLASPREERDAIRAAAQQADVPARIVARRRPWRSQVEKRSELFRVAIEDLQADWLLVTDGDTAITRCNDFALRAVLATTGLDVCQVLMTELNLSWPYSEMPANSVGQRHLYRAIPGLRVRHAHNGVVTPAGRWLNGDTRQVDLEPALNLTGLVELAHDNNNRGAERNQLARGYRKTRERERLEAWL